MVGPVTPLWVCPPLAESQPSPGTSTPPNDGDESGDAGLHPASLLILALPSFAARTACCSFSNCWQKSSPNVSLVFRDACSSSRRLELSIDALSWPLCQLVVVQAPGCTGVSGTAVAAVLPQLKAAAAARTAAKRFASRRAGAISP